MNLMGNHRQMRENLEPRKIAWQSTQKVVFVVLGKEDYLEDPEALYSPVSYFRKLFDDEITSNIVDYTNTYSLQCDPDETEQSFDCCFFVSSYGIPYFSSYTHKRKTQRDRRSRLESLVYQLYPRNRS